MDKEKEILNEFSKGLQQKISEMIFEQYVLPQSIVGCLYQEIYNIQRTAEKYPELMEKIMNNKWYEND